MCATRRCGVFCDFHHSPRITLFDGGFFYLRNIFSNKMSPWRLFLSCFNGPNVYRKYEGNMAVQGTSAGAYGTNLLEENCGFIIKLIEAGWTLAMYTSPFLVAYSASRRTVVGMSPEFALKFALGVALVYGGAYLGRGFGRAMNKDYMEFLRILFAALDQNEAAGAGNRRNLRNLRKYDFDFRYWPVNYRWRETDKHNEKIPPRRYNTDASDALAGKGFVQKTMLECLSYIAAHTVARRLMYPGTLALLKRAVAPALDQGRTKLVQQMNGQRFKLQTRTGNEIDTMFVDRRNDAQSSHGHILVITCEGNAGFYEAGSATTPLEAQYSVLMWNHPGFGASTGVPWPSEEAAAIDVVVQFALNQLGWDEGEIVLYGWSIGGFTATWATMNYRNIRALFLDATFDDVVPLALNAMPQSWSTLVSHTVQTYMNLNIRKQLDHYNGPVTFVRRLRDEVMAAATEGTTADLASMRRANRVNNLLKAILINRYPNIFEDGVDQLIDQWVAANTEEQAVLFALHDVDVAECQAVLENFIMNDADEEDWFPLLIGENLDLQIRQRLALYLVSRHLVDYDSTHCTPLPADRFVVPSHPWE